MDPFIAGLVALFDPPLLLALLAATLGGVMIGALPGLNAATGAALLLPFTITMDPVAAIAVLTAIHCSATFVGAITTILINTVVSARKPRVFRGSGRIRRIPASRDPGRAPRGAARGFDGTAGGGNI